MAGVLAGVAALAIVGAGAGGYFWLNRSDDTLAEVAGSETQTTAEPAETQPAGSQTLLATPVGGRPAQTTAASAPATPLGGSTPLGSPRPAAPAGTGLGTPAQSSPTAPASRRR